MNDPLVFDDQQNPVQKPAAVSFDLNKLLNEIFKDFLPAASEKAIALNFSPGLPDYASNINFDHQNLKKILWILLRNAVKYNKACTVEFGYSLKDTILEFFVKDTGTGIPEGKKKSLFTLPESTEVVPDSQKPPHELIQSKALLEQLGGKIWLGATAEKGSEFFFTIPFIPVVGMSKSAPEGRDLQTDFSRFTILVAEDDEINFVFLERLLSKTMAKIIRAANGLEAVNMCKDSYPVDLILMDINMPFMNGLEATRIIKSDYPKIPIIAVTAYTIRGDRETCLSAGCSDYIPKPIRREELFEKLRIYLPLRH